MPTASGMPMPMSAGQSLASGFKMGDMLIQNLMNRQKMEQQAKQFQEEIALRRAAAGRAAAMLPLQQQLAQLHIQKAQMEVDPAKKMAYIQQMLQGIGGVGGEQQMPIPTPTQEIGEGLGMFTPEGLQEAQQAPAPQASGDMGALRAQIMKHMLGIDPNYETPQMKRAADLQSQIELANIKSGNKAIELQNKEKVAVEKDLPQLKKSLKGIDELLRIAQANPDMFGHGFMPDRYARITKIKDFGKWQNLISDAIAGLEQKLSAKGNLVALKMAAQLKPSHAEQQAVAIGKLESMRQQLQDSINQSNQLLGKTQSAPPSFDLSQMTDEQLRQIASGGQ